MSTRTPVHNDLFYAQTQTRTTNAVWDPCTKRRNRNIYCARRHYCLWRCVACVRRVNVCVCVCMCSAWWMLALIVLSLVCHCFFVCWRADADDESCGAYASHAFLTRTNEGISKLSSIELYRLFYGNFFRLTSSFEFFFLCSRELEFSVDSCAWNVNASLAGMNCLLRIQCKPKHVLVSLWRKDLCDWMWWIVGIPNEFQYSLRSIVNVGSHCNHPPIDCDLLTSKSIQLNNGNGLSTPRHTIFVSMSV